ncbi:MAG: Ig-like domain repeat protein, partial [Burkholderiales bacterium]|nr:Ig-like domain repeat protein [Burkholderiales bacterium]
YVNTGANWTRWLDTFTNATDEEITVRVAFGGQSGIGASGANSSAIVTTSSGDAVVTPADAWAEYATPLNGSTLVGGPQVTVIGTPTTPEDPFAGASSFAGSWLFDSFTEPLVYSGHEGNFQAYVNELVLPPGESRSVLHFLVLGARVNTTTSASVRAAVEATAAALVSAPAISDLSTAEICSIANFDLTSITVPGFDVASCVPPIVVAQPDIPEPAPPVTTSSYDVVGKTIAELRADMESGVTTSQEITRAYLDRIAVYDEGQFAFNAFEIVAGDAITLTATVSGLSPAGGVTFVDGAVTLCANAPLVAGEATCTTAALPAGFRSLVASYPGDVDDAPSASAPFDVTVLQATPSIALASSSNPAAVGSAVTLTADIGGLAPTGFVDFLDGAAVLCPAVDLNPVSASLSRAQCTVSTLAPGPHDLTAAYIGDVDNAAATSAVLVQQIVQAATTTSLVSSPNPSAPGAAVTLTATITGSAPTGGVTFRAGATALCTAVVPSPQSATTSTAQCVVATLAAGPHSIVAEFAGDAANLPSTSAPHVHTVSANPAIVTLASSANPSTQGQTVTYTATVAGASPSGAVTFNDGAATLCAAVALVPFDATTSHATCATGVLATGTHSIVASYGGDAANGAAASAPLAQVVNPGGVTTVSGPSATGSGTITATITGCAFETWAFVTAPRQGIGWLGRLLFPHGLFEFTTTACTPGMAITVSVTYPQTLLPGTRYWKFGPTAGLPIPHWYLIPATISGRTATFTIVDGGLGDDDLAVNGRIVDQGGPSADDVAAVDGASAIPALSPPMLALTALLVAALALALRRRRAVLRDSTRSLR